MSRPTRRYAARIGQGPKRGAVAYRPLADSRGTYKILLNYASHEDVGFI